MAKTYAFNFKDRCGRQDIIMLDRAKSEIQSQVYSFAMTLSYKTIDRARRTAWELPLERDVLR